MLEPPFILKLERKMDKEVFQMVTAVLPICDQSINSSINQAINSPPIHLTCHGGYPTAMGMLRCKLHAMQAGTSGCTVEAAQFREHQQQFDQLGAQIVGISGDSPKDLDIFQ